MLWEAFKVEDGWEVDILESTPETNCGSSIGPMGPLLDNRGLLDDGLPNIGPEKACLLTFLAASYPLCISNCGSETPSTKGDGRGIDELFWAPSFKPEWALEVERIAKLSSMNFLVFSASSGDECHKLLVLPLTLVAFE